MSLNINFLNNSTKLSFGKNTKASFFYVNDLHGQAMHSVKNDSDCFDAKYRNKDGTDKQGITTFKVSSGDTFIGTPATPQEKVRIWSKFLDMIGIEFSAIGNHDLEISGDKFVEEVLLSGFNYLCANLKPKAGTALARLFRTDQIKESTVVNKNGENFGFIGSTALNLHDEVCDESKVKEEMTPMDIGGTIASLQLQVDQMKKQTNKIVLLSHCGAQVDKILAKNLDGVDIIIGGHSHDILDGVVPEKNLLYSDVSGEPVLITQAGRDGNTGEVSVIFDDNGVLIPDKLENTVHYKDLSVKDSEVTALRKEMFVSSKDIAIMQETLVTPDNANIQESRLASLVADSMRYVSGADVAFINSGNIRGALLNGVISTADIEDIAPFPQKLFKITVSEKDLVDALKHCTESFTQKLPGVLQVSGLEYTVSDKGELIKASLVKDGEKKPLNINNPDPDNKISLVICNFLLDGKLGFSMFKRDKDQFELIDNNKNALEGRFNLSKADALKKYVEEQFSINAGKSIPLMNERRITVING